MTSTISTPSPRSRRASRRHQMRASSRAGRARQRSGRDAQRAHRRRRELARYIDVEGRPREVISQNGAAGSVLVVDRDAHTLGDRRLVAHLGADEPQENAQIVCSAYVEDARARACGCRLLTADDLRRAPFADQHPAADWREAQAASGLELRDPDGRSHRLELLWAGMSIPELRWRRLSPGGLDVCSVSVREVVAALESYEPVRALTRMAVAQHHDDARVSVTALRAELERVLDSPIVLNRGLRDAVLAGVRRGELSMSQIATRCGRVKRDSRGNESGETSWLARRLGILPEGGHDSPTPWIHSDVLGLISRSGLGISPREVEL